MRQKGARRENEEEEEVKRDKESGDETNGAEASTRGGERERRPAHSRGRCDEEGRCVGRGGGEGQRDAPHV